MYSPIDILNFNRGQGIDEEEDIRSMENTDFYVTPLVDVKIRLVTSRTYTNQDTLYYSGLKGERVPYMIIAPISNQVIDFKNVYSKFKEGAAAYGIGFAEYKKSVKSGVSYWHVDFGSKVGHIIPPTFMF
ncbi:MAG: hypothetical protein EAZ31_11285 [Cytophagia bacterium]|nr:MAG: hypothetical protein EAZ31_11285 [Cytophagia bacterium]